MAFVRPSPVQLRDRIAAEFDGLMQGADPRMRRSVEGVLARIQVIVSVEMLLAIEWASKQMHIATADKDGLPIRAAVWGMTLAAAVAARGPVVLAGNIGAPIAAGTELRRADDARFRTVADCIISGTGFVTTEVLAVLPGTAGNCIVGTTLTIIEPVENVQAGAAVGTGGIEGGLDVEEVESLRARTSARIQEPPHGGADFDYVAWVKEVVGETRVWVLPLMPSIGSVSILFLMPDGSAPEPATVDLVRDHVAVVRPVTAHSVVINAPIVDAIPFTIALSPDTVATRQAAAAELADMLLREAEPGGTTPSSRISAAISSAPGEYSHVRTVPAGDIVSAPGHIARLGSITWL
jgi:uncharacterized phage protein gp47/JayE